MDIKNQDLLTDTPLIALDMEIMERNIQWLANLSKEAGVKLRPHTKTHKSPFIAKLQIEAGASGITTAKLGEAEVMANAGIDDILIAFPIIGKNKLKRFNDLLQKANLTVALDDWTVAKGINAVGENIKKKIPVYIDVDTGLGRMGRSAKESVASILEIAKLPFISIKGLMSHSGHAYAENNDEGVKRVAIEDATILYETKMDLEQKGIYIDELSIGASATARMLKEIPFITEARPGMYVFNDRYVMGAGGAKENDCAVSVIATVVSHPSDDRLLIDAGSKTLSSDLYKGGGHGLIKGHENLVIDRLSEEHGIIKVQGGKTSLRVGDLVEIIPNHICPVINLTDEIYGFRNGNLERTISIEGRGKNR
ncbi:alanine racemase [Halalkalibacter oceani]|uniref:alanine racemase n=1 Tax=Halalkalibacter oceani TaxID=1653776 RepID=UPI0033992F44